MTTPLASERRTTKRRDILEHFSFYICVPKLGFARHKVNDISESGIGFLIETLGEFKVQKGEVCDLQFYLNQSLYLPMQIEVMRQVDKGETQEVGALFKNVATKPHETFMTLVKLVDQLTEFGVIQP